MRDITHLIVHCADTYARMDVDAEWIRRIRVDENGWSDNGYHFVIKRDGTLETGRPIDKAGAHAKGMNSKSIAVCLIGGRSDDDGPEDNFTEAQRETLAQLVIDTKELYEGVEVIGHYDVPDSGKTCPNFNVEEFMETVDW